MFNDMQKLNDKTGSKTRWIAYFMLVIGITLFLSPLVYVFTFFPLVGQLLSYGMFVAVVGFGIISGTIVHCTVIAISYVFYRPKLGILMLLGICVCIGLLFI